MSTEKNAPEFFIGWEKTPPPGIAGFLRLRTGLILGAAMLLAAVFPLFQSTLGIGQFQFGNVREFSGVLVANPVPMLLTPEPEPDSQQSVFLLVRPLKYGFDPEVAETFHLEAVDLRGTLIHDGGNAMLEVIDGSVQKSTRPADVSLGEFVDFGSQTLRGEIVDSKCYLGVMNPGVLKPHRACAIHCIKGGVPPMLLLRGEDGSVTKLIMTGVNGEAINEQILDLVAEPVEVTGKVSRCGSLLFVATDPETGIRRIDDLP